VTLVEPLSGVDGYSLTTFIALRVSVSFRV